MLESQGDVKKLRINREDIHPTEAQTENEFRLIIKKEANDCSEKELKISATQLKQLP